MSISESRVGLMAFASHFVMFFNLRAHNPAVARIGAHVCSQNRIIKDIKRVIPKRNKRV